MVASKNKEFISAIASKLYVI